MTKSAYKPFSRAGADASGLANNVGLGLYDLVKHANFPGFHSMPSDHLACNKSVWDAMPESHRTIMSVAMEALALRTALTFETKNAEANEVQHVVSFGL